MTWEPPADASHICIDLCKARCCRTSTFVIRVDSMEEQVLTAASKLHSLPVEFVGSDDPRFNSIRLVDGHCPFLLDDMRCGVYMSRPKACRMFPHRDHLGCLIRPGKEGDPAVTQP